MKKILVAFISVILLIGCAAANSHTKINVPTQTQQEQIAKANAFTGTITGGNFAKGVGFSNINIKLEVTSDNGDKDTFYVRSDSIVADVGGEYVDYLTPFGTKGKKVEIKYYTITDGTGGDPSRKDFSYEIGKKGVLMLRFLDWTAPKK